MRKPLSGCNVKSKPCRTTISVNGWNWKPSTCRNSTAGRLRIRRKSRGSKIGFRGKTTLSAVSVSCCSKQATSSARRYTALSVWQGIITSPVSIRSKYRTSRVSLTSSVMISSLTVQPGIFCILLPRRKANWITGSKSKPDGKSITW